MPFYFFANPAELKNQSGAHRFGIDSLNPDEFRLTSMLRSKASSITPTAYAVTSGRLCAVATGTDRLTIILQPDKQPGFGAPIKYFVYKGIKRSSILDGSNMILPGGGGTGPTDLINRIHDDFDKLIQILTDGGATSFPSAPDFKSIGLDYQDRVWNLHNINLTTSEDITIDSLFYSEVNLGPGDNLIPLPRVEAGDSIGQFVSSNDGNGLFALEILLDQVNFNPTVKEVNKSTIETTVIDNLSGSTDWKKFSHVAKRTKILNYMDPAAFYGSLVDTNGEEGVLVKPSNAHYTTADQIYLNLLRGVDYDDSTATKGIFYTRNYLYVDIRDKYNNPYNFFTAQGTDFPNDDLQIQAIGSTTYNAVTPLKYLGGGDKLTKWPILIFEDMNATQLDIAFPILPTGDGAFLAISNKSALLGSPTFRPTIDVRDNFTTPLTNASSGAFTNPVHFSIPLKGTGPNSKALANYIKIRYIRTTSEFGVNYEDELGTGTNIPSLPANEYPHPLWKRNTNYLDFTFPMGMDVLWLSTNFNGYKDIATNVYYEDVYIDNTAISGRDFMGYTGIAKDAGLVGGTSVVPEHVHLFAFNRLPTTTESGNAQSLIDRSFSLAPYKTDIRNFNFDDSESFLKNLERSTSNLKVKYHTNFIDGTNSYRVPELINSFAESANAGGNRPDEGRSNSNNINDFILLSIPGGQYDALKADWESVKDNYVKGTQVYLSYSVVDTEIKNGRTFAKVHFYFQGFLDSGSNTILSREITNVLNPRFTWVILNGARHLEHQDDGDGELFDFQGSRSFSVTENTPTDFTLNSTIYFLHDPLISATQFNDLANYVEENIHKIWTTANNPGLTEQTGGLGQKYTITDNIIYRRITSVEYSRNGGNIPAEALVLRLTKQINGVGRSFMTSRYGVIYDKDNPNDRGNVAAHEFGHALGLTDRYAYIAKVDFNGVSNIMTPNFGSSKTLYIPLSFDPDYAKEFRWWNNLYSTARPVPSFDPSAPDPKTTLSNDQYLSNLYGTSDTPSEYFQFMAAYSPFVTMQTTVFITPKQWDIIKGYASENGPEFAYERYVFFMDDNDSFGFNRFVGWDLNRSIGTIITNRMISDIMTITNSDDTMLGRINAGMLKGMFHPFKGLNLVCKRSKVQNNDFNRLMIRTGFNFHTRFTIDFQNAGLEEEDPKTYTRPDIPNNKATDFNYSEFTTAKDQTGFIPTELDPDEVGGAIWDEQNNIPSVISPRYLFQNKKGTIHNHEFTYDDEYPNRLLIIDLVIKGKLV